MATSFIEYRGFGFWANDGLLELWLDTLAEAVPRHAPAWLQDAQEHWRVQARTGFHGFISAGLDDVLADPDRVPVVLDLADRALAQLAALSTHSGHIPAAWLNQRVLGGERGGWPADLDFNLVRQIPDAFRALLRGELHTTAATSGVLPRLHE